MGRILKTERLKSSKTIGILFSEGASVSSFPLRLIFKKVDVVGQSGITKIGFSVPKRNFKKAVDRNRIKRLLREAYRKHKPVAKTTSKNALMLIYIGKTKPVYAEIEQKTLSVFKKLEEKWSVCVRGGL